MCIILMHYCREINTKNINLTSKESQIITIVSVMLLNLKILLFQKV